MVIQKVTKTDARKITKTGVRSLTQKPTVSHPKRLTVCRDWTLDGHITVIHFLTGKCLNVSWAYILYKLKNPKSKKDPKRIPKSKKVILQKTKTYSSHHI